jgi:cobalamin biosynthesis Mg chelatase CobN
VDPHLDGSLPEGRRPGHHLHVEETEVPEGYTATVSGDATAGFTVTNAHTPETTSVPVTKKWVGSEGSEVTIHLLADGEDTGQTLTLSADNDWTSSFDGLAKYADGKAIAYTISEDPIEGYTSEVSGDAASGFTVTNTEEPEEPKNSKNSKSDKSTSSRTSRGHMPQTGDSVAQLMHIEMIVAMAAVAIVTGVVYLRRRKHS